MSFDGLFTYTITKELKDLLVGGRILKVHQPYPNEIILTIRANGKNHKLLISAHPTYSRVQITNEGYENPKEPPMFCMLLRKHLEGFFVEDVYQKDLDRIIILKIKGRNEIGDIAYKQLIIEIMGRHSNIILVDEERNLILDSIKHVSYAVNRHRAILPGQEYVWPPEQNKINPFTANLDDVLRALDFNSGKLDNQLVNKFSGISPLFAKEVLNRAGLANRLTVPKTFLELINQVKNYDYTPTLIRTKQKEIFYMVSLHSVEGEVMKFASLSELLDHYYFGKAERDRVKQMGGDIEKFIKNEIDKLDKKIAILKETLVDAENSQQYMIYGELLTAYLHLVKKGMKEITVMNYYDESGGEITIQLDPLKTPSENAKAYFTKYNKGKKAKIVVKEQLETAEMEKLYFEGLLQQMETASPKDIEEIKEELEEGGYIRARQRRGQRKTSKQNPELEKYYSKDGTLILVGKNNKQNDYLTTKVARKDEIWLHTKDIPGSHVVIRSEQPSESTILEAAEIAAYFSKARNSSSVPVDFTKVKYVRKPSGAKPGFVIYDHQQTVYVTPKVETIAKLKEQN